MRLMPVYGITLSVRPSRGSFLSLSSCSSALLCISTALWSSHHMQQTAIPNDWWRITMGAGLILCRSACQRSHQRRLRHPLMCCAPLTIDISCHHCLFNPYTYLLPIYSLALGTPRLPTDIDCGPYAMEAENTDATQPRSIVQITAALKSGQDKEVTVHWHTQTGPLDEASHDLMQTFCQWTAKELKTYLHRGKTDDHDQTSEAFTKALPWLADQLTLLEGGLETSNALSQPHRSETWPPSRPASIPTDQRVSPIDPPLRGSSKSGRQADQVPKCHSRSSRSWFVR